MTSRIITALVGIPVLVLIIGWGSPNHFSFLIFLLTVIALYEYFSIAFPGGKREQIFGIFYGVVVSLAIFIPEIPEPGVWLGIVVVVVFSSYLSFGGKVDERYNRLGWTLLGILYLGYLIPHLVLLYRSPYGREWVFFVLLVIMAGDTAAYFVGSALGRNKLSPEISPGKTVEGALAALAASLVAAFFGGRLLLPTSFSVETLVLGFVFSLLGQTGDLFESWIKRAFSVKDSGKLLPGHGGLLDRMDSLIFPAVFAAYYVRLLHP